MGFFFDRAVQPFLNFGFVKDILRKFKSTMALDRFVVHDQFVLFVTVMMAALQVTFVINPDGLVSFDRDKGARRGSRREQGEQGVCGITFGVTRPGNIVAVALLAVVDANSLHLADRLGLGSRR